MRKVLILVIALACSSKHSDVSRDGRVGDGSGSSCPFSGLYCDRSQDGITCTYPTDGGHPTVCLCSSGLVGCNDCPNSHAIGACTAGDTCHAYGFEDSCACTCDATGQWSCTTDDPDPNFHCDPP